MSIDRAENKKQQKKPENNYKKNESIESKVEKQKNSIEQAQ